ncbi:MAG: glycosyltransferase [Lawsonibacter sp.]|nr:glycosyltransferase [Lawsonibacter sp.]
MRCGVLIPAYQPDGGLPELVSGLEAAGLEAVVVDDGSTAGLEAFRLLEQRGTAVLRHPENRGKGRALKTGLAYMAGQGFQAAVTADADGQHTVEDILRVARALEEHPGRLILGARDVAQMLPRSRAGNTLTRRLFQILHGIRLQDTQTGLRGIPFTESSIPGLLELSGDRYEYEMEMLLYSGRLFPEGVTEIPIETIYLNQNQSSHFRPLADGMKIYRILFRDFPRFLCSSLLAFGLDYAAFNALYYLVFRRTLPATVLARVLSAGVNFQVNRSVVFRAEGTSYTAWNYLKLALCLLALNGGAMYLLVDVLGLPAAVMKLIVEALLYLSSFAVQSRLAARARRR